MGLLHKSVHLQFEDVLVVVEGVAAEDRRLL